MNIYLMDYMLIVFWLCGFAEGERHVNEKLGVHYTRTERFLDTLIILLWPLVYTGKFFIYLFSKKAKP